MVEKEGRALQYMEVAVLCPEGSTSVLFEEQQQDGKLLCNDIFRVSLMALQETKIKGYINIIGYKVIVDENINPGKYGFRLIHSEERTHFFSSDESLTVREWMKALMKATIGRDYTSKI